MKSILIVLICFLFYSCSSSENRTNEVNKEEKVVAIEYHILPQSIVFMSASSGDIFQYCAPNYQSGINNLLKNSQYVNYDQRGFHCNTKKEQLCTYFYKKDFSELSLNRFQLILDKIQPIREVNYKPLSRAVICATYESGNMDTIFINNDRSITHHGSFFQLSDSLLNEFLSVAPLEIYENWKYDLGDISDVRLDQIKPR